MSTTKNCKNCKKDLEITSFKKWKNGNYLSNCILCNKRKLLSKNKKTKLCKECLIEKPYNQFSKTEKSYSLNCLDCVKKCELNNINKRKIRYYIKKDEYLIVKTVENTICSRCKQKKNTESFKKRKNGEYYKQCIECNNICAKNKLKNRKIKENENIDNSDTSKDKKNCVQCFKVKLLVEFNKNKNGYTKNCSKCLDENVKRNNKRKEDTSQSNETKKCARCFVNKSLSCYKITKNGIQKQCDECCLHYKKLQQNNKKALLVDEDKLNDHEKQCTRCLKIKIIDKFKTKKHKHCLDCCNSHREYLIKNRCSHGCLNKSACVKCLGGSICEHKRKKSECKDCNFHGYLYQKVRARIALALKKGSKSKRSIEYLYCDIITFKKHIENKFVEGMTWENYGKIWHIDHIVPINYNNPTLEEVIKRLHYINTQPLWASENISKGNRYIG